VVVTAELLAGQVRYYRQRAPEYDATAYPDGAALRERIGRLVAAVRPSGDVLEVACGTGMWTGPLTVAASSVTAMDAAPEMVRIARGRVRPANVKFVVADIFSWAPPQRFDTVFFAFWLSHVPASRFEQFWRLLRGALTERGRVLFVDEHSDVRSKETYVTGSAEVIERYLADGSVHHLVKAFVDPARLTDQLHRLGWHVSLSRDGSDWVIGEASPVLRRRGGLGL
jgi:2-polyprenyl-3-methyl-5-hydroxy-6-metoxy-1,4-benzoquinol methylase